MKHPRAYAGQQVVILGLARSGKAAAKLFHELGARVTVNDRKDRTECPEADELSALGIRVICGYHPDDLVHEGVELIVKNPGIPYTSPPVARAAELGIEIVTEVEVAFRMTDKPIIGITGSNGKTTTTTLVGEILKHAGKSPVTAGNIGRAMCEVVMEETGPYEWIVAELSSFQLKGTDAFRPKIACLLNVSETHLDYHGTMDDYIASKLNLFRNQTPLDYAVLNADDPVCMKAAAAVKSRVMLFSMEQELAHGVYVRGGEIVYRDGQGAVHAIMPANRLGIPGSYNVENALAATAVSLLAGAAPEHIAEVLRAFRGVAHRLEYVAEIDGVRYYNNSKATNASAAKKALEAIAEPVILIAGGLDRGSNLTELVPVLRERVKALIAFGETRHILRKVAELAGVNQIAVIESAEPETALREAVAHARSLAAPGDVVMLNPACASWDMFPSFEERGRMFKESVHNLK